MSDKIKVILDCDTGSDDAVAICTALLSPEKLDVLGICTVNGNRPVPNTTENTLRVKDLLGSDVPVIRGCYCPMVKSLDPRREVLETAHSAKGEDGKEITYHAEYLDCLPPSHSKPLPMHAVTWLIDTLMNSEEKITVVPVGPLTNIAMALRLEPRIAEHIEQFVIMGGGHLERNSTAAAEFNIWVDPEAAQIVFESGVKIVLMPLDATHRAYLTPEDSKYFRSLGTKLGDFIAQEIDDRVEAYNLLQPLHIPDIAPMHDALCVAYLLDPSVITDIRHVRVDVDFSGGLCDGETVVDTRLIPPVKPKNCYLCMNTDSDKFASMLRDILSRAKN